MDQCLGQAKAILTLCLVCGTAAGVSNGQCDSYLLEEYRTPFCGFFGYTGMVPQAISELGTIVGYYANCNDDERAYHWSGGPTLTPLPNIQGLSRARAFDVNVHQQIIGRQDLNGPAPGDRGFVFANGTYTDLGNLLNSTDVEPLGINDHGQICGWSNNSATGPLRAFLWKKGSIEAIELPAAENSFANDINNSSQVVGWVGEAFGPTFHSEAFLWQNGVTIGLGIPRGGISSSALAISNNGHVAGLYWVEIEPKVFVRRGFHWRNGVMTDLGVIPPFVEVVVRGVNDRGEIVGWCEEINTGRVPFIWRDGVMTALHTLVQLPPNMVLDNAHDINNQGQIAAEGRIFGPVTIFVGFRLTPQSKVQGDYNCDHAVNVDDLLGVINHWGPAPGHGPADFNRDGLVDLNDLLVVIDHWTF